RPTLRAICGLVCRLYRRRNRSAITAICTSWNLVSLSLICIAVSWLACWPKISCGPASSARRGPSSWRAAYFAIMWNASSEFEVPAHSCCRSKALVIGRTSVRLALLLCRLFVGMVFIAYGAVKLLGGQFYHGDFVIDSRTTEGTWMVWCFFG